jgi:hypothetical protein
MRHGSPILPDDEDIRIQLPAARYILQLMVRAYNINAAKGVEHFYPLIKGYYGYVRLVRIRHTIRRYTNGDDVAQCPAVFK